MKLPTTTILALSIILTATLAHGEEPQFEPPYRITIPDSWSPLAEQSQLIAKNLARAGYFGDVRTVEGAAAYASRELGVSLVVSRVSAVDTVAEPGPQLAQALARIESSWRSATLTEGATESLAWKVTRGAEVLDASLEYRHHENETVTLARSLLYLSSRGRPELVIAECTLLADSLTTMRSACEEVLATLELVGDKPRPLPDIAPARAPPVEPDEATLPSVTSMRPPASGTPGVLMSNPKKSPSKSYRWLYIAGGLLLITAFYFTTRSRNSELEESRDEDEGSNSADEEDEGSDSADEEDEGSDSADEEDEGSDSADDPAADDSGRDGKEAK